MGTLNFLCYFPTTVAVIDDSKSFLAMVNKMLNKKQLRQLYSNPQEALRKINSSTKSNAHLQQVLKNIPTEELDELETGRNIEMLVEIELKQLYKKVYDASRFGHISVVLVDYNMSGMNGIEFCRSLQDKSIKKIMITAISDYQLAVQAFNEGIIDKFILKDTPNLFTEINSSIVKAQEDYFKNIYGIDGIFGFIFRNQLPFDDMDYVELLNDVVSDLKPAEYYLLDKNGSMLFLDENAKPSWFIVRTKDELEGLYNIAKDHKASANILALLKKQQAIPILLSEEDYQSPVTDWEMFPAKPISPKKKFFYSLIMDRKKRNLDLKKITSFQEYAK